MNMIERVARALFQRDVDEDVCDGTWEDNETLHESFRADARAAILAMREPIEAMCDAGNDAWPSYIDCDSASVYRAMIDAALND